jgi:hypothetical protein
MPDFYDFFGEMRAKLKEAYANAKTPAEKEEIKALLNELVDAKEAYDLYFFIDFVGKLDDLRQQLEDENKRIKLGIDDFLLADLDRFRRRRSA